MKIVVLNGSPKGDRSVTMQYVKFIRKSFPQHEFNILNIAGRIKEIERNEQLFNDYLKQIEECDIVLWAYPLYFLLVSAQYKRFIELIFEKKRETSFKGKYAAALSTSIHFFDNTALSYIESICNDLEMNFVDSFTPEMHDIFKKENQAKLITFAEEVFNSAEMKLEFRRRYDPLKWNSFEYTPSDIEKNDVDQRKKS